MMFALLKKIINRAGQLFSELLDVTMHEQWLELFSSKHHNLSIKYHRAELLSKRTKYFSLLFGIIVPFWSVVDYHLLPFELWYKLAFFRVISGAVFLGIAYGCHNSEKTLEKVRTCMWVMLMTPTCFFIFSNPLINDYQLTGFSGALVNLYTLLPFLVIASLSIFTLTIKELIIISTPIVTITIWDLYPETSAEIPTAFMLIWLFLLLVLSSFFSSVSQMRYMISQVTRASYDSLTNAMTRRAGIEAITLFFRMASLQNSPLSLLFIDLDDFKSLNDKYGHERGDEILIEAVKKLKLCIRKGDNIIRWGGEEFLLLLPYADHSDSRRVIERIIDIGLGKRPDGKALTASIGLAEVQKDAIKTWEELVVLADTRMYEAKRLGKARCVGCQGKSLKLMPVSS